MKQVSLIINIVLVAAVAILFYLYSSLKKNVETLGMPNQNTAAVQTLTNLPAGANLKDSKIAYINIDSLDYNYQYIIDNSKEIRARQAGIEAQYQNMVAKFQADYQSLQEAAQAGLRPQAELEKEKARLEQMQYEIAAKEKQMQALGEETGKKQGEMLRGVSEFIAKLNNGRYDYILAYTSNISSVLYAKPTLDITKEVIDGLNADYKAKKAASGKK
ncbi:MAG: OmpH family outer membrane protein [Bacteroidia bacterium]